LALALLEFVPFGRPETHEQNRRQPQAHPDDGSSLVYFLILYINQYIEIYEPQLGYI
jgi:hypothetical protein